MLISWCFSGFDNIMTKLWDANNRGVCRGMLFYMKALLLLIESQRQWKDIRHKYVEDDS